MAYTPYSLHPSYLVALGDRFGATAGRPNPHRGLDTAPEGGGPAYAIADGTLVYDWYSPGMGNVAVLEHADGMFSGYNHLAAESPVTIGTKVKRGQAFATIGNSGSLSNGRHLHLTVATTMAGAAGGFDVVDPLAYINAHPVRTVVAAVKRRVLHVTAFVRPTRAVQKSIQRELKQRNRYPGLVDGKWGRLSVKGVQRTIQGVGYPGLVDGLGGTLTSHYVQVYAKRFGDYTGPVDNDLGPNSWAGFLLGLERP